MVHSEDPTKRLVPLTQGKFATVDACEYDRVTTLKWSAHRKVRGGIERFYAVHSGIENGKRRFVQMHRFILGVTDPSIQVDHRRTSETLNNCRENLRDANASLNGANREFIKSGSGYKGVAIIKKRPGRRTYDGWRGEVTVNGKRMVSPIYRSPETAAHWYDETALAYFGEFARLNFPRE